MKKLTDFKKKLVEYLTKSPDNYIKCEKLIKFEPNSKFDFSFAINFSSVWSNYFNPTNKCASNILTYAANDDDTDNAIQKLIEISQNWSFQIQKAKITGGICEIYLNRRDVFRIVLDMVSSDDFCQPNKIEGKFISITVDEAQKSSITHFRLKTIEKVLENLIKLSDFNLTQDQMVADSNLMLTTRSNPKNNEDSNKHKIIVCGVVCSDDHQNSDDFLQKRQEDIHLTVINKYGLKMESNEEFLELKKKLGNSAAILEMVEIKHSSVLRLSSKVKQAFILYNSARLETILATFRESNYPPLPTLCDVNLDLLTEEGEWELLKNLLTLPDVLEKSLGDILNGQIALHTLHKYLTSLVNSFSNYYSKKKILTENRPHLVPVIHAKIHLLLAIQKCLNLVLKVFDIEPVMFM